MLIVAASRPLSPIQDFVGRGPRPLVASLRLPGTEPAGFPLKERSQIFQRFPLASFGPRPLKSSALPSYRCANPPNIFLFFSGCPMVLVFGKPVRSEETPAPLFFAEVL